MIKKIEKKYSYDDVLIVPQYSAIVPKDVKTHTYLTKNIKLKVPIISSPMDTVTEYEMAIEMAHLGGAGFIHKNMSLEEQIENIKKVKSEKIKKDSTLGKDKKLFVGVSISYSIKDEDIHKIIQAGADAIVLDSSHGHSKNIIEKIQYIKKHFPDIDLIAGNISTKEAAKDLAEAGADAIRVGMGPGSICTTRIIAGIGVPQLSAIIDVKEGLKGTEVKLIADGGIRSSGDMVKALMAGADTIMLGSLLAGSKESPTEKIWIDDIAYKSYRGMGSIASMKLGSKERYGQKEITNPEKFVPEGVEGLVIFKGPIKDIIYQNVGGIKSGMGYVGARNIKTLQKKCLFIEMTNASLRESHPHSLNKFHNSPNYKGTKNG